MAVVDLATSLPPPPICCSGPLNLRCSRDIDLSDSLLEMPTAAEEEAEAEEAAETAARMLSLLLLLPCLLGAEEAVPAADAVAAAFPNCGFLGGVGGRFLATVKRNKKISIKTQTKTKSIPYLYHLLLQWHSSATRECSGRWAQLWSLWSGQKTPSPLLPPPLGPH